MHRLKGLVVTLVSHHGGLDNFKGFGLNALLKPDDLQVFSQGGHAIILEVLVKIMLLNMKLNVLVKIKTRLIPVIGEGLDFGHDRTSIRGNPLTAQELSVEGPKHLAAVLGLLVGLAVRPPGGFAPYCVENVKHNSRVCKKPCLERASHLEGLIILSELLDGQVMLQDGCTTHHLVIEGQVWAVRCAIRGRVSFLRIGFIIGSSNLHSDDVIQRKATSHAAALTQVGTNLHKTCSCRALVKGQLRGRWSLGVLVAILELLLGS